MVGTPLVPTPSGRRGAQRRARAAPLGAGTGPARSHAQRPLGREHGEHGEDPPLARSEHRGTSGAFQRENRVPSYPQMNASRARVYARRFLDSWIQGFGVFNLLILLVKTPRPLTNGGLVLTNGGLTPD